MASIPGAFSNQTPRLHTSSTAPPRLSGARSHVFHPPPRTPSAPTSASSSLMLTRSATLNSSSRPNPASRKRSRTDYNHESEQERERARRDETPVMEDWSSMATALETPGSPKPFVNTRYLVKGGMDTPSLAAEIAEGASEYGDVTYRRLLNEQKVQDEYFSPLENLQLLRGDSNGRSRVQPAYRSSPGWSLPKTALEVVGGVVGKVWEFCKISAFRGFQAGGGKAYTIPAAPNVDRSDIVLDDEAFWETEKSSATQWGLPVRESTPVPGQYPQEPLDFIPDYFARSIPSPYSTEREAESHTPPRPSKRRQISNNSEEIVKNWVVVPPPTPPSTFTPSRLAPSSRPAHPSRYSMPTASSASRRTTGVAARPASRAGVAACLQGGSRKAATSRVSHAGSPGLQAHRGASFASPRSPGAGSGGVTANSHIPRASTPTGGRSLQSFGSNGLSNGKDSPAAREAQRWAALKRKEERVAEESLTRLERQLKAMIREGKEALGTKVEVEIEDEGGGNEIFGRRWAV